jgi:hypothetical protein
MAAKIHSRVLVYANLNLTKSLLNLVNNFPEKNSRIFDNSCLESYASTSANGCSPKNLRNKKQEGKLQKSSHPGAGAKNGLAFSVILWSSVKTSSFQMALVGGQ